MMHCLWRMVLNARKHSSVLGASRGWGMVAVDACMARSRDIVKKRWFCQQAKVASHMGAIGNQKMLGT